MEAITIENVNNVALLRKICAIIDSCNTIEQIESTGALIQRGYDKLEKYSFEVWATLIMYLIQKRQQIENKTPSKS